MNDIEKLVSTLEELAYTSEQYYKWANQFDLRIEDIKLRSSIAKAKSLVYEIKEKQAGLAER